MVRPLRPLGLGRELDTSSCSIAASTTACTTTRPSFTDRPSSRARRSTSASTTSTTTSKGARDALKFENELREAYVDIKFRGNFSLRAGKQQIIWGESDGFRLLDRANALDLSWHFFYELPPPAFGLDDLRIPFWMIKGLYDFGSVGSWSNVFAEAYWNPGDWRPEQAHLPARIPGASALGEPAHQSAERRLLRRPCPVRSRT